MVLQKFNWINKIKKFNFDKAEFLLLSIVIGFAACKSIILNEKGYLDFDTRNLTYQTYYNSEPSMVGQSNDSKGVLNFGELIMVETETKKSKKEEQKLTSLYSIKNKTVKKPVNNKREEDNIENIQQGENKLPEVSETVQDSHITPQLPQNNTIIPKAPENVRIVE